MIAAWLSASDQRKIKSDLMIQWTDELEQQLHDYRYKDQLTLQTIASLMNLTIPAIKNKLRRLGQAANSEQYTHPIEKIQQLEKIMPATTLNVLETHAGYGNLTRYYTEQGHHVHAIEIDADRATFLKELNLPNVEVTHKDALHHLLWLEYNKHRYDLIDIDPYGLPSRFLPSCIRMIDNGLLVFTIPKFGATQLNKITLKHWQSFWNIETADTNELINKVTNQMAELGFQNYRKTTLLDYRQINRVWRFAFKIEKAKLNELVGMHVNRTGQPEIKQTYTEDLWSE